MMLVIGSLAAMIRLAHDASGVPRLVIGLAHSALQFGGLGPVPVVSSSLASRFEGTASLLVFSPSCGGSAAWAASSAP